MTSAFSTNGTTTAVPASVLQEEEKGGYTVENTILNEGKCIPGKQSTEERRRETGIRSTGQGREKDKNKKKGEMAFDTTSTLHTILDNDTQKSMISNNVYGKMQEIENAPAYLLALGRYNLPPANEERGTPSHVNTVKKHETSIDRISPIFKKCTPMIPSRYCLRKGKWTTAEEKYANKLIDMFKMGLLDGVPNGISLRTFLAEKLSCGPMRISKKFQGSSAIGKQMYNDNCDDSDSGSNPTTSELSLKMKTTEFKEKVQRELKLLEADFYGEFQHDVMYSKDLIIVQSKVKAKAKAREGEKKEKTKSNRGRKRKSGPIDGSEKDGATLLLDFMTSARAQQGSHYGGQSEEASHKKARSTAEKEEKENKVKKEEKEKDGRTGH